MTALIMIFWCLAYIVLPLSLFISMVVTGFVRIDRLNKIYTSVVIIALAHLLITSGVTWIIRDGLLCPKSVGREAWDRFFEVMKLFYIYIIISVSIATLIFMGRIKKRKQTT